MRGRHFPERRPSVATNNPRKRRGSSRVATGVVSKNRAPVKPVGRKIPFAPQVAEERETIARFASFPNGDPNLAAVKNNGDRTHDLSATSANVVTDVPSKTNNFSSNLQASVPSTNGRNVKDLTSANNSRDASPVVKQSGPKTASSIPDDGARAVPMSPQIPTRKNRAHTAPFSDTRSAETQADLARRAQSATVLRTPETEDPSLPPRAPAKTSVSPYPMTARADLSVAVLSTSRAAKSIASPVARADRAAATPMISNSSLAESQPSLPGRAEGSPPIATQITTTAASHLAMQNFNTLQGASSSSNMSKQAEEVNVTYGKDAYEHYGIAQGVVLPMRVNIVRRDSTGSGSRSVSN